MQNVLVLQNDAQGYHSVDHFRKEILYIIFHLIFPEFYLAVQKEAIQSMAKPKGIETKCLM